MWTGNFATRRTNNDAQLEEFFPNRVSVSERISSPNTASSKRAHHSNEWTGLSIPSYSEERKTRYVVLSMEITYELVNANKKNY